MSVRARVAVLDPLPLFQEGVVAALSSKELLVESPSDVLAWLRPDGQDVIFLSLISEAAWSLLKQLTSLPSPPHVVAILDSTSNQEAVNAIHMGAISVLLRQAMPDELRGAMQGILAGYSWIPFEILKESISQKSAHLTRDVGVSRPDHAEWLKDLAEGSTVAHLADKVGYSERAMFRLLRTLYLDMGVRNRTEALILAHQRGWLRTRTDRVEGAQQRAIT